MGDDHRYMQILLNFISNALKFTNNFGKIKVVIQLLDIHQLKQDSLIEPNDANPYESTNKTQKEQYAKF